MTTNNIIAAFPTLEMARDYKWAAGYWAAFYEIIFWGGMWVIQFNFEKQKEMLLWTAQ